MKTAIVSDIHGNLEAWHAVLEDINACQVQAIYCLGDMVGYGANPTECVLSVQEHCTLVLQGNHEHALLHPIEKADMNPAARQAITWTWQQVSAAAKTFLEQCALVKVGTDSRLVHSSPDDPLAFHYISNRLRCEFAFKAFTEPLCFVGHTHEPLLAYEHVPGVVQVAQVHSALPETQKEEKRFLLSPTLRYIINAGSVGQPRDGDPRARWVLVNNESMEITYHYVPYNIEAAQKKIIAAGLPRILADRLKIGK